MKHLIFALTSLVALGTWAEESAQPDGNDKAPEAAQTAQGPASVRMTEHPLVRAKFKDHEDLLLRYRPSENLPEITNEELLAGTGSGSIKGKIKIGTLPALTMLPCDEGCKGNSDYDKAVKAFLNNYNEGFKSGLYTPRGKMTIKVRWFKQRGFFEKQVPIPGNRDIFAISFPMEGKLFTLSMRDGLKDSDMENLVIKSSGILATMLALEAGIGVKPFPLRELLPAQERSFLRKVNDSLAPVALALDNLFGVEDRRSRLEPMSDADSVMLPAFDGIDANEVEPLTQVVFFNAY